MSLTFIRNITSWNASQIRSGITLQNAIVHCHISTNSLKARCHSRFVSSNRPHQSDSSLKSLALDSSLPPPTAVHTPKSIPKSIPSSTPSSHTQVLNPLQTNTATPVASSTPPSLPPSSPPVRSVRLRIHTSVFRNSSVWTPENDHQLLTLRSDGKSWGEIATTLQRSRQSCNRRYNAVLSPETGMAFWEKHPEKIQLLKDLRSRAVWSWREIADQLGTIASSCELQWKKMEKERLNEQHEQGSTHLPTNSNALRGKGNQQLTKGKVKTVLRYKSIDVTKLKDAITQYGTDQWNIISVKVFKSEVSPESLKRYYLEWERKRKRWWESQNEQLVRAVFDTCKKNQLALPLDAIDITTPTEKETAKALLEKIDVADILNKDHWQTIAENVSGEHTASECRERWIRMQSGQGAWDRIFGRLTSTQNSNNYYNNNDNNNIDSDQSIISESVNSLPAARIRWSSEQSRRLEKIVIATRGSPSWKRHGWENVSKLMNHEFTRQQCKSRWIRLLGESKVSHTNNTDANTDTNINNDNNNMYSRSNCGWLSQWSRGEIEHLIMGIHEFGFNWGDTQQKWVQGRTTKSCHAKWRTLNAKLHLEMKIRQNPWSKVCTDIYGDEMGKILAELPERWPTICDERKNVKSQ